MKKRNIVDEMRAGISEFWRMAPSAGDDSAGAYFRIVGDHEGTSTPTKQQVWQLTDVYSRNQCKLIVQKYISSDISTEDKNGRQERAAITGAGMLYLAAQGQQLEG